MTEIEEFGPLDSLVIEFPGGAVTEAGFLHLLAAVEGGSIRILDLEFVGTDDGVVRTFTPSEVSAKAGIDLSAFEGSSSGLLEGEDLGWVGSEIASDSIAAVLIYEELSVLPAIAKWTAAGARVLSDGPVEVVDLVEALDATEGQN